MFRHFSVVFHFCRMKRLKCFLSLLTMCVVPVAYSQYYYNDIIALQQSQNQYEALQKNNIKQVTAASFNGNRPDENFKLEQRVSARSITITSSDPSSGDLLTINTYNNGKLVHTTDSSANVMTVINYAYDANGNITNIRSTTDDAFMNSHSTETHLWSYRDNLPAQMLRIKDNTDTTMVTFAYEGNNVAQETWKRKGKTAENYYYYYDDNNRITDIVRFNPRVNKMLPDFVFAYDEAGRLSQMTQVPNGSSDYLIWKYIYNNKGLKDRELLYSKQKQLVGRIEYSYQ